MGARRTTVLAANWAAGRGKVIGSEARGHGGSSRGYGGLGGSKSHAQIA